MPVPSNISASRQLVKRLQHRSAWPDSVATRGGIELIETHISWVLLTDDFAWKIKKPVRFDFLDFSTLKRRKHFCERELELNRRFSPDLYVDVVAFHGTPENPHLQFGVERRVDESVGRQGESSPDLDGNAPDATSSDEPFEVAVRMHRFDQRNLLSRLAVEGEVDADLVDALADRVAAAHQSAEQYDNVSAGEPTTAARPQRDKERIERLSNAAHDNFEALSARLDQTAQLDLTAQLERWSHTEIACLKNMLANRCRNGFVRHCHGDLHLGNIVRIDGEVRLFDCIEFNDDFRWIDVMSEVAFVMMDLDEHDLPRLAWRFLNRYLEHTGDYEGVMVLPFFLVYRAMIRAKVDAIRLNQSSLPPEKQRDLRDELQGCLNVAADEHDFVMPTLILMHGVSGSGKTFVSQSLVEQFSAIRVRSDVERKRLAGLTADERPNEQQIAHLYGERFSQQTYDRLLYLADTLILSGHPVIVDATFLSAESRRPFLEMASRHNANTMIVKCHAPLQLLRDRVQERTARSTDASDADEHVLRDQMAHVEPPGSLPAEQSETVVLLDVDSSVADSVEATLASIRAVLNPLDQPVPTIARYALSASE